MPEHLLPNDFRSEDERILLDMLDLQEEDPKKLAEKLRDMWRDMTQDERDGLYKSMPKDAQNSTRLKEIATTYYLIGRYVERMQQTINTKI